MAYLVSLDAIMATGRLRRGPHLSRGLAWGSTGLFLIPAATLNYWLAQCLAVRQFSVDALFELGYHVLEAATAGEALDILKAHPEINLLFTDIVMPDMNGRGLADQAALIRPDVKVLYATGYTRNAVVHNGVVDKGVELIGKPFTLDELARRVRDILDKN